ncbi:MAG: hypothetical protein WCH31_09880 [Actinomycetes bacterium]
MKRIGVLLRTLDLRREEGLSLVLALGVLLVFSVTTVTASTMALSSRSTASVSNAQQNAYALAEAGLNNAMSVLENVPTVDPTDPYLLPASTSPNVSTYSTGSVSWWGTYDLNSLTWSLAARSTVPNPLRPGATIQRQLTQMLFVGPSTAGNWNRIYDDDTAQCLTLPAGENISVNIGTRGPLCLNGATITGATTVVDVGGTTTLTPGANTSDVFVAGTGSGSTWVNPSNITVNDTAFSTTTIGSGVTSGNLIGSNFGFGLDEDATVVGIQVRIHRTASISSAFKDNDVRLLINGTPLGADNAGTTFWGTGEADGNYGATNNTWGLTLKGSDINNANFGVLLNVKNSNKASATASVDYIQVTVTYAPAASIGSAVTPVAGAYLVGTCTWSTHSADTPCSTTDHVYASASGTTLPSDLNKPVVDFDYWYTNAAPGPNHGCDVRTGTPPVFDNNRSYDSSVATRNIVPTNASYTCIAKNSDGIRIGEISWNSTTHVLTVYGSIFFDGEADFSDKNYVVHYQGRAAIYSSDGTHVDAQLCAGGSGTTSCYDGDMTNWDPTHNLLVLALGDRMKAGNNDCKLDEANTAFQGILWTKNNCLVDAGAKVSAPIITNKLVLGTGLAGVPHFFQWPGVGGRMPGVTGGNYTFTLGPVSG